MILLFETLIISKGRASSGSYKQSMKPRVCPPEKRLSIRKCWNSESFLWPYITSDSCSKYLFVGLKMLQDDLHFALGMVYLISGCNYRGGWGVVSKCS